MQQYLLFIIKPKYEFGTGMGNIQLHLQNPFLLFYAYMHLSPRYDCLFVFWEYSNFDNKRPNMGSYCSLEYNEKVWQTSLEISPERKQEAI